MGKTRYRSFHKRLLYYVEQLFYNSRGVTRIQAASKMEFFATLANVCKLLSNLTKYLISDVSGVLDTSINSVKTSTLFTTSIALAVLISIVKIFLFTLTAAFTTFYASTCNKNAFRN